MTAFPTIGTTVWCIRTTTQRDKWVTQVGYRGEVVDVNQKKNVVMVAWDIQAIKLYRRDGYWHCLDEITDDPNVTAALTLLQ